MKFTLLYLILTSLSCCYSQNLPSPEQVLSKQVKPKGILKELPPGDYIIFTPEFDTKAKRVEYAKKNMAKYCISEPVFSSAYEKISHDHDGVIIDTSQASSAFLLTIKMSDNNVFVFFIHNLCDNKLENTGYVNLTFFNFRFGEVDASSIKSFIIKKKRLYINNNTFTEELTIGQMKLTIKNKTTPTTLLFAGKTIELMPLNISKYADSNFGE